MKIYRVSGKTAYGHQGYTYHSSKRDAEKAANQFLKDNQVDRENVTTKHEADPEVETSVIDIPGSLTKSKLILLLQEFGGHPDNG